MIDQEKIKKNAEIWNQIINTESNVEKLLKFNLVTSERLEEIEKEYIGEFHVEDWEIEVETIENQYVPPSKIVGTNHPDYKDQYLNSVLENLKRFNDVIYGYLLNSRYYEDNRFRDTDRKKLYLAYKRHEDKYYICGEGNHRFFLSKIIGLDRVFVNKVYVYDEDVQLKQAIIELKQIGFDYKKTDKGVYIISENIKILLHGDMGNVLRKFIYEYKNLDTSRWNEFKYKLGLMFNNNYRKKYEYIDDVKSAVHFHYLKLIEHKRNHTTQM
ncbi:hypothetical protein ETC01_00590 [Geobacillus sp. NFOSA3]|uniref:hypothetical protein n=1 Tax=Parageobacillus toebii TaxID=153151 RepID=UPI0014918B1E|nr:hypothetical protein [Parageobacillus toebii]MED4990138.1 hypothetical protein [Parageobacillus toebii]NNU91830.1 hypothetical protein [Geobacillus sp. NFOSA3]